MSGHAATSDAATLDVPDHGEHEHEGGIDWIEAVRVLFVAAAAAAVWLHVWEPFSPVSIIGVVGLLVGSWPIFKEAAENALERRMTMELSMSIAIVAAAAISEYFTALVITLFVLVAEILEELTVSRGRRAIRTLLDVLPRTVNVRRADGTREVSLDDLAVGDVVLVSPGGLIAVDGEVVGGHSFVDQASITGESLPVEKAPGAGVYAGTVNQTGALEVRTQQVGRDTTFGRIVEAVERAEQSRAPVQRLADRMAGYLVYFALAAAVLTFLVTRNVASTISVIIVAGACGIAAGTPLAVLGGIGRSARRGAIIKGGRFLETLGRVDMVVLDKTGTLTFGRPEVQAVVAVGGATEAGILDLAASAELRSEHPLGKAIVERGNRRAAPSSSRPGLPLSLAVVLPLRWPDLVFWLAIVRSSPRWGFTCRSTWPRNSRRPQRSWLLVMVRSLVPSWSPIPCGPRRSELSRRSIAWGSGRCC